MSFAPPPKQAIRRAIIPTLVATAALGLLAITVARLAGLGLSTSLWVGLGVAGLSAFDGGIVVSILALYRPPNAMDE